MFDPSPALANDHCVSISYTEAWGDMGRDVGVPLLVTAWCVRRGWAHKGWENMSQGWPTFYCWQALSCFSTSSFHANAATSCMLEGVKLIDTYVGSAGTCSPALQQPSLVNAASPGTAAV